MGQHWSRMQSVQENNWGGIFSWKRLLEVFFLIYLTICWMLRCTCLKSGIGRSSSSLVKNSDTRVSSAVSKSGPYSTGKTFCEIIKRQDQIQHTPPSFSMRNETVTYKQCHSHDRCKISLCHCYLEEVFSAVSIFYEALNQLHKICLWCFKHRLICLRQKKAKRRRGQIMLFCKIRYIHYQLHHSV